MEDLQQPERRDFRIDKVLRDRNNVLTKLDYFVGKEMTTELADGAATEIERALQWWGTKAVIRDTLLLHTGKVFEAVHWKQIAWQIAANRDRIVRRIPLAAFVPSPTPQWVAAEIVGVAPKKRGAADVIEIEFRACTGLNAGFSLKEDFTEAALYKIAKDIGFSFKNPYDGNAAHLFGLRIAIKIVDAAIERFVCPDSILSANRKVIRYRRRDMPVLTTEEIELDTNGVKRARKPVVYGCPKRYEIECVDCQLTQAQCPASYK